MRHIDRVKETLGAVSAHQVADEGLAGRSSGRRRSGDTGRWCRFGIKTGQRCFRYDAERGVWVCPRGGELKRIGGVRKKGEVGYRSYKGAAFRKGEVAHLCRKIPAVSAYQEAIEGQKDSRVRELMARRKQIVEPVFGVIRRVFGFRRWRFWGLDKVRAPWYGVCLVLNLRKLYRMWLEGRC